MAGRRGKKGQPGVCLPFDTVKDCGELYYFLKKLFVAGCAERVL